MKMNTRYSPASQARPNTAEQMGKFPGGAPKAKGVERNYRSLFSISRLMVLMDLVTGISLGQTRVHSK